MSAAHVDVAVALAALVPAHMQKEAWAKGYSPLFVLKEATVYAHWHDVVGGAGENVGANAFVDGGMWAKVLVQEGGDFGVAAVERHVERLTEARASNKTYYLCLNKVGADGYYCHDRVPRVHLLLHNVHNPHLVLLWLLRRRQKRGVKAMV